MVTFTRTSPTTKPSTAHVNTHTSKAPASLPIDFSKWVAHYAYPTNFDGEFFTEYTKDLSKNSTVYDPFCGAGSVLAYSSAQGFNSIGYDTNPIAIQVSRVRTYPYYSLATIHTLVEDLIAFVKVSDALSTEFPTLINSAFSDEKLSVLRKMRQFVLDMVQPYRDLFTVMLNIFLRETADCLVGYPYIQTSRRLPSRAFISTEHYCNQFAALAVRMLNTYTVAKDCLQGFTTTHNATNLACTVASQSVDLIYTAIPFLDNYDYIDRTRLEFSFWNTLEWSNLKSYKTKSLLACVYNLPTMPVQLSNTLAQLSPSLHKDLSTKIQALSVQKRLRSGAKRYEHMVAGYFNGIVDTLSMCNRTLKTGGKMVLILGDSCLYDVYVPTPQIIGSLAASMGFGRYTVLKQDVKRDNFKQQKNRHNLLLSIYTVELTKTSHLDEKLTLDF